MMELWSKKLVQTVGGKGILYYGYKNTSSFGSAYFYAKPSLDGLYAHKYDGPNGYLAMLQATDSSQLVPTELPNNSYDGYFNLTKDSVGVAMSGSQFTYLRDTSLDLYK